MHACCQRPTPERFLRLDEILGVTHSPIIPPIRGADISELS